MSAAPRTKRSHDGADEHGPFRAFLRKGLLILGFVPPDKIINCGTLRNGGVVIKQSTVEGADRGLFAGRAFAKGEAITVFGGQLRHMSEKERCDPIYTIRLSGSDFLVDGYSYAEGIAATADAHGLYFPRDGDQARQWRQGAACMANQRRPFNSKFEFVRAKDSLGGLLPRIPFLQALEDIPEGTEIFVDYGSGAPFNPRVAEQQYQVDLAEVRRLLQTKNISPENLAINLDLMAGLRPIHLPGGGILEPARPNGLHEFKIYPCESEPDYLATILEVVEQNYLHQAEPGARCVGLLASLGDPEFNGYSRYDLTLAPRHDDAAQQRRTAVVSTQAGLNRLLSHELYGPPLARILGKVLQELGFAPTDFARCKYIHFLAQDERAHARFWWHVDNKGNARLKLGMITAIVQLSSTCSEMQIFGFEKGNDYTFDGRGFSVIFHGGAIHRSCITWDKRVTYKVVFFLQ